MDGNMEALDLGSGKGVFSSDQEYLDAYLEISRYFNERREILDGVTKRYRVPPKDKEERKQDLDRLEELVRCIQDAEWYFWERVARSKEKGYSFFLEDFAGHYGLSHLEKRIVLFFLCSRLSQASDFSLSKFEIVEIFDIERSILKKMQNLSLFREDCQLLKNKILIGSDRWSWDSSACQYQLNPKLLNLFCQKMEGTGIQWSDFGKEKADIGSKVRDVGFIKDPDYCLDNVMLPQVVKDKLDYFLTVYKSDKLKQLGIDSVIKRGKGLSFLFYGPPGTGKSMLADAVADAVNKKLLVVETQKIYSCWLGDTEKNIHTMFECAKENDLVLLIDEADSLIYSRSRANYSYTMRFTNVVLTELERFEGIAIFTTNLDDVLDEAMERRIALKIKFEIPNVDERIKIWKSHIPAAVKLGEGINFVLLANQFEFSGGYIKNAVLNALRRLAYRNSDTLTMDDLTFGAETEKQGMFGAGKKAAIGFK